jgi:hypothetical protein
MRRKKKMNKHFECSLNDTTELRKLIVENPDLPLVVFCGEDSWTDTWAYEWAEVRSVRVDELTIYNDEYWLDREDYEDRLRDDLCEDYEHLSDEEYDAMIDKIVAETDFEKAIVVYVG